MPLLTRMVGTPLTIDIGPGAVAGLAPLLADRRISSGGHVAVVVGPGLGEEIAATLRPQLGNAEIWDVAGGSVQAGAELAARLRQGFYDAVVGIGGGRTLDVAKYAASLSGLPMVAVATSLAHDGIASPVASLEDDEAGRKGSYGVQMPIAVVVDLDYVRRSEPAMRRSGIGDAISNLSAIADWRLAERERGEAVDGVAVTFARIAATSIVHREDGIDDDDFLIALAEALVLSGLAMATAGLEPPVQRRRPRDPARDRPPLPRHRATTASWPARRACSPPSCAATSGLARGIDACLRAARPAAHAGRPRAHRGAVRRRRSSRAPGTRPDRYTILEHLGAGRGGGASARVAGVPRCLRSLSCARPPSRRRSSSATAASTGRAGSTSAALSPYLTRRCCARAITPNGVTWLMILAGVAAAAVLALPGVLPRGRRVPADPAPDPARLLRRRAGPLARRRRRSGVYLDRIGHWLTEARCRSRSASAPTGRDRSALVGWPCSCC